LAKADAIALALPALCELGWVPSQAQKFARPDIAEAIRGLMNGANVLVNRPAVEAGLAMFDPSGDFADGVIWGKLARCVRQRSHEATGSSRRVRSPAVIDGCSQGRAK
jgi:hypothetical protein